MQNRRETPKNPLIMIPARLASTRLPNKPLADIAGLPMIVHVLKRSEESAIGPVVVACESEAIADVVRQAGGRAVLTRADHPSGSDRIWEALQKLEDGDRFDAIINVQGDVPTLDPAAIRAAYDLLQNPATDIGTLVAEIYTEEEKRAPQVVKAVVEMPPRSRAGRALYFSRTSVPNGDGPLYHHIGIYAYRRAALEQFVQAPPGILERRESLEQLRALAMGLCISAARVDIVPLGVDTPDDLEKARRILAR